VSHRFYLIKSGCTSDNKDCFYRRIEAEKGVGTQLPGEHLPSVNNHGANVSIYSEGKMLTKLRSHVMKILSPNWCDSLVDSTPAHGNKKVSIGMVGPQLLWGMLTGKKNLYRYFKT
jgi:hypothetical protein